VGRSRGNACIQVLGEQLLPREETLYSAISASDLAWRPKTPKTLLLYVPCLPVSLHPSPGPLPHIQNPTPESLTLEPQPSIPNQDKLHPEDITRVKSQKKSLGVLIVSFRHGKPHGEDVKPGPHFDLPALIKGAIESIGKARAMSVIVGLGGGFGVVFWPGSHIWTQEMGRFEYMVMEAAKEKPPRYLTYATQFENLFPEPGICNPRTVPH